MIYDPGAVLGVGQINKPVLQQDGACRRAMLVQIYYRGTADGVGIDTV